MRIVVIGGSAVGLAAAVALADAGHEVEVLERTAEAMPDTVDEAARWARPTVPQGLHSHSFPALGGKVLRERAPDVHRALLQNGAGEADLTDFVPPTLTGFERRQEDADLRMLTVRRSTFELVLRRQALARPGVTLTPGATVHGLTAAPDDRFRVTGVRLAGGGSRTADVVVDATGQRTAIGAHLSDIGLPPPRFDREPCRIAYYTRHYRLQSPAPGSTRPTGLFSVGDAACTTNPAYGRGVYAGARPRLPARRSGSPTSARHRQRSSPTARTCCCGRGSRTPAQNDRGRAALWEAAIRGDRPPQPPAGTVTLGAAMAAATSDDEVWRRVTNVQMLLRPPASLYHDEEMRERIWRALGDEPPPRLPGVTHRQLVDVVGAPTLLEQT